MSPLIMYMTSSLGSLWNSLRNSRPRATKAMLSGACQRTVLGRPEALMAVMTCPRLTAFSSSIDLFSCVECHRPDRADRPQPFDLRVVEAQPFAQDIIRVLTEQRRRRPYAAGRLGQPHRRRHDPRLARGGMLALDQDVPCLHLRVLDHAIDRVDRAHRDARPYQNRFPFVVALRQKDVLQPRDERLAVLA